MLQNPNTYQTNLMSFYHHPCYTLSVLHQIARKHNLCQFNEWFQHQGELCGTYLVFCVPQNTLHGALSCSLNHLLNVIILGLQSKEEEKNYG